MKVFILSRKLVVFLLILGCFVWFHRHIGDNNLSLHKVSGIAEFARTRENGMDQINFKCKACDSYHEMTKKFPAGFSGWAYSDMEWSDFEEEVPPLSEKHWIRSDRIPKMGELRIIKVKDPFDEEIGNEFYMEFMPALAFFNGYDNVEQIHDSAIVQCRLEKIVLADEDSGWIRVKILNVILLSELFETYPSFLTDRKLEEYAGVFECDENDFMDAPWEIKYWSSEGAIGEHRMIYMDANGIRHLVLMHYYDWYSDVTYFGNIVEIK